ncbi:hypothetical protein HNQ94_003133 [Salirhabdus euzebyi]|uniref:DUF5667 domain-containing protein n=1 Tax=Salirhabdus euzebyi TaxID=394506 RepID=A0A841Q8K2_9BACI|nr:DUF5667 domain-containing protein [Salirhabdus euzebyi]MBB6454644.1 hypothetical protein [Salirhabdus euzebyi]
MKKSKWLKTMSASALIVSLALPTTIFAEEDEKDIEVVELDLSAEQETINLEQDLFYYLHAMFDQLKLALSDDQVERANILVGISEEAISKAQLLLEEGNEEAASVLLNKAAEAIKSADELADNKEEEENTDGETISDIEDPIEIIVLDPPPVQEEEEEQEEYDLESKIGQNVIALTLALEKVGNPNAKAALERNIAKSLKRLEAKYGNIDELKAKLAELNASDEETEVEEEEVEETEQTDMSMEKEETSVIAKDDPDRDSNDNKGNNGKKLGHNKNGDFPGKGKGLEKFK